jgi:YidC/Oxa1 family membrane protein insertase
VGIYDLLAYVAPEKVDMGITVIIFTICFRVLWLPVSFSADRSEKEKREIAQAVTEIERNFSDDPIAKKREIKKLLKSKPGPIASSAFDLFFQVLIAIMLIRMFSTGLQGSDFHLLYKFIPQPTEPFNLTLLDKFDLTKPNLFLNFIQSFLILSAEVLTALFSPFPTTKRDLITIIFLPIISFFLFLLMPSGKKLFIITTLSFSIILMLVKQTIFLYHSFSNTFEKFALKTAKIEPSE